jgi:hypothetical protein
MWTPIVVIIGGLLLVAIVAAVDDDPIVDLHIGGVFPMTADTGGWAGGQACLPAVQMVS